MKFPVIHMLRFTVEILSPEKNNTLDFNFTLID